MGFELQVERMSAEAERLRRKQEQIAHERRQADEERQVVEARDDEAHEELARAEGERRGCRMRWRRRSVASRRHATTPPPSRTARPK